MSATSGIILILFSAVIIAAIGIGEEKATNIYFEQCKNSHKNTSCNDTVDGSKMRRCRNNTHTHFYCTSTSPIQVAIGRVNSTKQYINAKTINITPTASSKNGHYSYCIEIAAETSINCTVRCRPNTSDRSKASWIPFNPQNSKNGSTPLPYVNVAMTDSKTFCNSAELDQVPELVPCDTWHICDIMLAFRYKHDKNITVKLVDLSSILNETNSCCPNVGTFFSMLQKGRTQKFDEPGLLAFQYQENSKFLLPYNPSSQESTEVRFDDSLVAFRLKCNQERDKIFIECQSSVLHSCGLQLVTKNLRIINSSEDCHLHLITVERIPVGAVLGGIFLSLLILLPLLIYLYKKISLERRRIRLTQKEVGEFMQGMQLEKAKNKGIQNVFVLPYDRSLEVSKIAVDFKTTILGSGAFGKVLKDRYKGQDVAIKTIDGITLNADAFRSLLSELKIMSYLGKHEHVMELVGAITSDIKTGEVYLILEYCANGSAISYMREHREDYINFRSDDKTAYMQNLCITISDSGSELSSQHLVRWSYEVACGMEYVSSLNIYHGDLAARNILLTENLTVKVGDFGLSKQLDKEKYACYVQKKECPLPLKWMAIESLRDLKFSIQSDVWSFGVTLWEFFSLGTIPYTGMEWNMQSWKSLCEGVRLDRPESAHSKMNWKDLIQLRPAKWEHSATNMRKTQSVRIQIAPLFEEK